MATGKYQKWLEPENLTLIQGWRRDGLSDEQVAKNMGIRRSTLHAWIRTHKAISDAYKAGSEVSTYEIENAMYKAATGHFVTETEQTETQAPDGTVMVVKKARKRYIPPSVGAQIFILKNRRSDIWKDKVFHENNSDGMLAQLIDGLKEPEKE